IMRTSAISRALNRLAWFNSPQVSILVVLVLVAALAMRGRWLAASLVIVAIATMTVLEGLLRIRVEALPSRDLPELFLHPRGHHLMDSSYPSGHVARVTLLLGIVAALLPARLPLAGVMLTGAAGVLMGIQRVHMHAHTGSDVVGGLLLGGGLAA